MTTTQLEAIAYAPIFAALAALAAAERFVRGCAA